MGGRGGRRHKKRTVYLNRARSQLSFKFKVLEYLVEDIHERPTFSIP